MICHIQTRKPKPPTTQKQKDAEILTLQATIMNAMQTNYTVTVEPRQVDPSKVKWTPMMTLAKTNAEALGYNVEVHTNLDGSIWMQMTKTNQ